MVFKFYKSLYSNIKTTKNLFSFRNVIKIIYLMTITASKCLVYVASICFSLLFFFFFVLSSVTIMLLFPVRLGLGYCLQKLLLFESSTFILLSYLVCFSQFWYGKKPETSLRWHATFSFLYQLKLVTFVRPPLTYCFTLRYCSSHQSLPTVQVYGIIMW